GLPKPANALGFRGYARASLGEKEGVEEMRQALTLAIEQGEGRVTANLYNNLALQACLYEGPQVSLDLSREGIEFCRRRGLHLMAETMAGGDAVSLAETGRSEQALSEAAPL